MSVPLPLFFLLGLLGSIVWGVALLVAVLLAYNAGAQAGRFLDVQANGIHSPHYPR